MFYEVQKKVGGNSAETIFTMKYFRLAGGIPRNENLFHTVSPQLHPPVGGFCEYREPWQGEKIPNRRYDIDGLAHTRVK